MLSVDEKKAIINYRIQKSYGNLNEAKEVAKLGFWNLVGNLLLLFGISYGFCIIVG